MMKILSKIFAWFSRTKIWLWFAKNVVGKINFRRKGYTLFPIEKYEELLHLMNFHNKNEDYFFGFVLSDTKSMSAKLIKLVTKEYWTHAGLINPINPKQIYHSISQGVTAQHLLVALKECDSFAIIKWKLPRRENIIPIMERIDMSLREKWQYDFSQEIEDDFNTSSKKVYCSEYNYRMLVGLAELEMVPYFDSDLGRKAFSPEDVYKSGEVIFEHRGA